MNNTRDSLPQRRPSTARRAGFSAQNQSSEKDRLTAFFRFYSTFSQEEEEEDTHTIARAFRFAES